MAIVASTRLALRSPTLRALLVLFAAAAGVAYWIDSIGGADRVRAEAGAIAPVLSLGAHVLLNVSPLPGDVVALANGSLYGVAMATVLNWLGWYIAAFIQFSIGRHAASDFDRIEHMRRVPGFLRRLPVGHPAYLLIARLLPYAGGHVTTWVPGAAGVRLWRFAWCTALAIIPASIGFAIVGARAIEWVGS